MPADDEDPSVPQPRRLRHTATMTTTVVRISAAAAAVAVLAAAVVFVVLVGFRPSYDAYGWLVWGHQALYGGLSTGAAPSWKPLTFLFTLPYALAHQNAVGLWMVTSTAAAFAAPVFAGRIAYRLTGPAPGRPYAPIAASLFAGLGVLGLEPWWHMILIASSDPMVVALCLAAIDCHRRQTIAVRLRAGRARLARTS